MGKCDFVCKMLRLWGIPPIIILCAGFIVGIIVGVRFDIRYLIVSAMVIFIMLPMILIFMYYYYGLGANCHFNIVSHNIRLSDNGVEIIKFFPSFDEEGEFKIIKGFINYNDIGKYKVFEDSVVFPVGKPVNGFIWLPLSAFPDAGSFQTAVRAISSRFSRNDNV